MNAIEMKGSRLRGDELMKNEVKELVERIEEARNF